MQPVQSRKYIVLIIMLCVLPMSVRAVSKLSYSYYYNDVEGDITSNPFYSPTYNLGTLQKDYTL